LRAIKTDRPEIVVVARQRPVGERIALAEQRLRSQDAAHLRQLDWALLGFAVVGTAAALATSNPAFLLSVVPSALKALGRGRGANSASTDGR
jgi:hypothetical protein